MDTSMISYNVTSIYNRYQATDAVRDSSFSKKISAHTGTGVRAVTHSTVDDYIAKHPNDKAQIDRLLYPGLKVMEQYGKPDAAVEEMSMDEYKKYIYGILDKVPYNPSQQRDTQFIDITEKGWEQMKNDPKYEAWVVGYFKVDRAVRNPFANYPGVEPRIHTEHFGATIEEHIGQSYPQSMSTGNEKDSEDWWKKRQKRHEQLMEQVEKYAEKREQFHKEYTDKIQERFISKASGNTYFDLEMNLVSPAAEFFMRMTGGSTGSSDT